MHALSRRARERSTEAGTEARRAEQSWWSRRSPRTATLIPTLVTLLMLAMGLADYSDPLFDWSQWETRVMGLLLALLVLDRIDECFYRPAPRLWVAMSLLATRVGLIEAIWGLHGGWDGAWFAIWLYAITPYSVTSYFGLRAGCLMALVAWINVAGRMIGFTPPDSAASIRDAITFVILYMIPLAFAVVAANRTLEEERSRAEVEALLVDLQSSHTRLQTSTERALRATAERNRLAREIQDAVNRDLSAVEQHLGTTLRSRVDAAARGDEPIRAAKQLASQALQDVRRSVRALRVPADGLTIPASTREPGWRFHRSRQLQGWRRWLLPSSMDLIPSLAYLILMLSYFLLAREEYPDWGWQRFAVPAVVLALLLVDRIEYQLIGEGPARALGFGLVLARLALAAVFATLARGHWPIYLLLLLPHVGLRYSAIGGDRQLVPLVWVAILALIGYILRQTAPFYFRLVSAWTFYELLLVLAGWTVSRISLKERANRRRGEQLLVDLQAAHEQLKASAQQELATVEERNRLARDIHDGLGHYLTVINVQLEKALAFCERDAELSGRAIGDARRLVGEALLDVRRSTRPLDTDESRLTLSAAVRELVKNVENDLVVDLRITGAEEGYAEQALMALFRVAQEGLTNIQKHARATQVELRLDLGEQTAELDLRDDGRGFTPRASAGASGTGGFGLLGLREHLELIGGTLMVESQPGAGTHMHAVVPKRALMEGVQAAAPIQVSV